MSCAAPAVSPQAAGPSPRPRSSTPSRSRPPRPWPRPAAGLMRARRCRAASGTSPWTLTGLLLTVLVTAASVQDRDAAKPLLWNLRKAFPKVRLAWADGIYAGKLVIWAKTVLKLTLAVVRRPDDLHTFQVLPRRWVVERTLAWITRCRRTVRDYERLTAHHETIVYWAMIITMSRRLAQASAQPSH